MFGLDAQAQKQCGTCREWKPLSSFHRFRDGRQSYCKPCRKAWDAAYWERNREYRIAKQKERRREIRDWLRGIKSSSPCPDCGGTFHWAAMTYDHLPGSQKKGNVSDLVKGGYRGVLIAEIAKCDLILLELPRRSDLPAEPGHRADPALDLRAARHLRDERRASQLGRVRRSG